MDLGIKGKVAIVTGGSRGLGRQAALSLAAEGCAVAICARGEERLRQTETELKGLGVRTVAVAADVTNPQDAKRIYEAAAALGPVDILVNNVGGSRGGPDLERTSDEQLEQAMQLNLYGATRLIHLALPGMKERRWGRIVNIASIWGREYGGSIAYMTAKAALIALSKHLALEVAPYNILVNSVAPGSVQFPGGSWDNFARNQPRDVVDRFTENNLPMGRFGWPEPVGDLVAYLASERAGMLTGACINIDGGQSRSLI
ncbi:MAG: SDR family oxidoreductase [Dehalococcoidia bacterium]|nr:SDR family oxidoreductase [Dehalococcoidia bacterium]